MRRDRDIDIVKAFDAAVVAAASGHGGLSHTTPAGKARAIGDLLSANPEIRLGKAENLAVAWFVATNILAFGSPVPRLYFRRHPAYEARSDAHNRLLEALLQDRIATGHILTN